MWKLNCMLRSVLVVAKRSLWLGLVVILAFTSSIVGQTVGQKTKPSESRAARPRLEVTSSGPGMVSGSFATGGYTIYFEAVRGDANPPDDFDAPAYGMDIRVMDWNHIPFLMQSATSTPLLSSWADDGTKDNVVSLDLSERRRAFIMLPAAARALKVYARNDNAMSEVERSDLEQVVALLESVRPRDLQDADNTRVASKRSHAATTTYTHKAFVMRKTAFFKSNPFEWEHSALLLRIYSSGGTLVKQQSYSNHGTPATDSSMKSKCFGSFVKPNANVYTMDRACDQFGSLYTTSSRVLVGHVCNNDTRQQYLSVKGSSNMNWGICKFGIAAILAYYTNAPDCD